MCAVVVVASLLFAPRTSAADDDDRPLVPGGYIASGVVGGISSVSLALNIVWLASRRKLNTGLQVLGWISGLASTSMGTVFSVRGFVNDNSTLGVIGLAQAAVGVSVLITTILAMPSPWKQRLVASAWPGGASFRLRF